MRRWLGIVLSLAGLASASAVLASGASVGSVSKIVGAERCRECHKTAYDAWARSAHARAFEALTGKRVDDPRCIQCHGANVRAKAGVQCESCHGSGRHYAFRYVMKDAVLSRIVGLVDVTQESCRLCHTETSPSIQPFEYDRLWALIRHGGEPKPAP